MQKPFHQLRKVMLQLVVVVLVAAGVGLIVLGYSLDPDASPAERWSAALVAFGFTFFTAGGVTMIWEAYLRRVNDQLAEVSLDAALHRAAPAIRDAVLDSLAFNAQTLKGVTSDEQLDHIAANALALRLDDEELARDLYTDLRDQVLTAPERWRDVKVAITLSPWDKGPEVGKGSMFVATIRWEYKVKPASNTMRFASVVDENEYRELLRDPGTTSAWHFDASGGFDAAHPDVFELVTLSVDGKSRKVRRTERAGAQVYTVSLGTDVGADQEVTVAYTYRGLVQRHGHLLYLDLPRPAKGLHVQLDYGHAGIRWMNTQEYFASSRVPRIEQAGTAKDAQVVNIGFDGWVLPRAGVDFVWVLEEEFGSTI
ncbi:hypothetical protein [Umezawaea sp. Da 62-37]|uniref:hypothetical protein n=1 Tax=Umezawaea sp. Da 62-37 TaxID=3075927 RepID=UPI0028F72FFB|nr:hypothetical protein [Umezawaea sp. Da 62-37]WNV83486.1 hypothetical protein RM788_35650 [Umezawaea sp. Da 62-37]